MTKEATPTLLYIPEGLELWRWFPQMAGWCAARHLEVSGCVRQWQELSELLGNREYDIGVIPSWEHLRPDRVPRLVAMEEPPGPVAPRQRPELTWPTNCWF